MSPTSLRATVPLPPDALGKRLRWAMIASLLINIGIWSFAAALARHPAHLEPRPVEITRVIMDTRGHKIEKVVTKKQIEKKIAQVHKEILTPKPEIKPPPPRPEKRVVQAPRPRPKPIQVAQNPPPGAHNRVLTAKPDKNAAPPKPDDHTALPDGNADPGKPTDQQNPGNAKENPSTPVAKQPDPMPEPAKPTPKPDPMPAPAVPKPDVKPEPVAPKPEPAPEPVKPAPKPKGPTREAEPADQALPQIPEELKKGGFKSFVRVKVEIDADGSFTPILRTSSGNDEIDRRVLEALKKWKWKPALQAGVPVKSTQLFKFEFEVE